MKLTFPTYRHVPIAGLASQSLVTLAYGYDGLGHRSSLSDSLGGEVDYGYSGDLLTSMSMSLNGVGTGAGVEFSYDSVNQTGQVTSIGYNGAGVANYNYDPAGRVGEINYISYNPNNFDNSILDLTYTYNAASRVATTTGPEGTLNFTYDVTGQLTGVSGAQTLSNTYDANGNRTMTGYQTGTGNQLLSDGTFTYTYDHDGRLATKTDASGNVWTYTWDNRNRLTQLVEKNSQQQTVLTEQLVYDVNNNLIGTILNGVPQSWTVWDGGNPYLQLDGTGNVTERYLTNPDTLDAFYAQVSASGTVEFLLTDRLGTVRMVTDGSGNVLDQLTYDAFGNLLAQTNAAYAPLYLFQGGAYDNVLGMYRFGARWYDPRTGRWSSEDPWGFMAGDSNLYRFVNNSPITYVDPMGLEIPNYYGDLSPANREEKRRLKLLEAFKQAFIKNGIDLAIYDQILKGVRSTRFPFDSVFKFEAKPCQVWAERANAKMPPRKPSDQVIGAPGLIISPWSWAFEPAWLFWALPVDGHFAIRVKFPDGQVFYFDDGEWGGIFLPGGIPWYAN